MGKKKRGKRNNEQQHCHTKSGAPGQDEQCDIKNGWSRGIVAADRAASTYRTLIPIILPTPSQDDGSQGDEYHANQSRRIVDCSHSCNARCPSTNDCEDIQMEAKGEGGKTGLGGFKTMIPKVSSNFSTGTPIYDDDDTTPENSDDEMPENYHYDDDTTPENSDDEMPENYDYEPRRRRRYSKVPRIKDPYMNKARRRIVGNDLRRLHAHRTLLIMEDDSVSVLNPREKIGMAVGINYSKIPRNNDPYMNKVRSRIVGKDPTFTVVNIGSTKNSPLLDRSTILKSYHLPPDDDWEGYGRAIGWNKHLKEINIQDSLSLIPNECLLDFLTGFVMNQSIQKLTIYDWPLSVILTALNPFFVNNQAFECLNLRTDNEGGLLRMESSLRMFRSLKEFTLDNGEEWECADGVMSSMIGHTGLRKLTLTGFTIRKKGSSALSIMLLSPKFHLKRLELRLDIDDEGARILADGLSNNGTLEDLLLPQIQNLTEIGWVFIFTAFQKSTCKLMHLHLNDNYFNDTIVLSLSRALSRHGTTLKSLNLNNLNGSGKDITIPGWISLFEFMRDPGLALENLDLSNNPISDAGLAALADALANNKGLKELELRNISGPHRHNRCSSISTEEWVMLSKRLRDPDSTLQTLDLSYNSFPDDDALICFAVALVNNHTLETLVLGSPDTTCPSYFVTSNSKSIFGTSNIEGTWAFTRDQFLCSVTSLVSSDSEYINSVLYYHLLSCCENVWA